MTSTDVPSISIQTVYMVMEDRTSMLKKECIAMVEEQCTVMVEEQCTVMVEKQCIQYKVYNILYKIMIAPYVNMTLYLLTMLSKFNSHRNCE